MSQAEPQKNPGILGSFAIGAKNGWNVSINAMLPGLMFAFVIMQILHFTGLVKVIEVLFHPVMGLLGLPGMAAAALIFAFLSTSGGFGIAVGLCASGDMTMTQMSILAPGIMSAGAMMQYMGRVLGTAGVEGRHYPVMIGLVAFNAILAIVIMKFIV